MSNTSTQETVVQSVYGALVGGLIASFLAVTVFTVLVDVNASDGPPFWAAVIGLVFAIGLMAGGLVMSDRAPWLGTALLFGSGFTTLWSVALSFSLQDRWVMLVALGVALVIAWVLGNRRFGGGRAGKRGDTPGGISSPVAFDEPPVPAAPVLPTEPSPEIAPPSARPEITLPPGVHPVDGGDIRD